MKRYSNIADPILWVDFNSAAAPPVNPLIRLVQANRQLESIFIFPPTTLNILSDSECFPLAGIHQRDRTLAVSVRGQQCRECLPAYASAFIRGPQAGIQAGWETTSTANSIFCMHDSTASCTP